MIGLILLALYVAADAAVTLHVVRLHGRDEAARRVRALFTR
jgi:hypothetical protein